MKGSKKVLTFLLCTIVAVATFCAVPLSVDAEEEDDTESQVIVSETLTEDKTENAPDSNGSEAIDVIQEVPADTANENLSDNSDEDYISKNSVAKASRAVNDSVTSSASVTSIKLDKTSLTLGVGETYTLSKSISPANATTTYRWACGNYNIASVNSRGQVTAKSVGTTTVVVITNNGKQATCKVTVKNAPSSVSINTSNVTLGVGETFEIYELTDAGSYANNFTWTSSNSSVATINKTTANKAKITAKRVGTATIKIKTYNGKTDSCTVTVKKAPTSIIINRPSDNIGNGESVTITESTNSGSYANSFTWSSSNSNIVSIRKDTGNKAIITANGVGYATISVKTYNGVTSRFKITAKKAPYSVSLSENNLNLEIGDKFTISEQTNAGTYANNFTWTSSNSNIASVKKSSDNKAIITAKKVGTAYIKITTYNGKVDTCKVVVRNNTTEEYIDEVIELTNAERRKAGLPALSKRLDVTEAAKDRAKEITVKFSHTRPNGESFFTIIDDYNISYIRLGENIAMGYTSPQDVVDGWMASEGHKKNILNPEFKGIGVGYYVKDGVAYWVQIMIA